MRTAEDLSTVIVVISFGMSTFRVWVLRPSATNREDSLTWILRESWIGQALEGVLNPVIWIVKRLPLAQGQNPSWISWSWVVLYTKLTVEVTYWLNEFSTFTLGVEEFSVRNWSFSNFRTIELPLGTCVGKSKMTLNILACDTLYSLKLVEIDDIFDLTNYCEGVMVICSTLDTPSGSKIAI